MRNNMGGGGLAAGGMHNQAPIPQQKRLNERMGQNKWASRGTSDKPPWQLKPDLLISVRQGTKGIVIQVPATLCYDS